ncbi:MAG: hypothetical protein D6681_00115 [Calditrichaeota bacterium]|nr:MAG: hypothetical protein D6681_00115 [Calditrichota bacterium]
MTYQKIITRELKSLPEDLLPEVLDFILFLKLKSQLHGESISEKIKQAQFLEALDALSRMYRQRVSRKGKQEVSSEEIIRELKRIREEIAADEYRE